MTDEDIDRALKLCRKLIVMNDERTRLMYELLAYLKKQKAVLAANRRKVT